MFNSKSLLYFALLILSTQGCRLIINKNLPGVFLQEYGTSKLILDVDDGSVLVSEGSSVQGICNSGFQNLLKGQRDTNNSYTDVSLLCQNGQMYYVTGATLRPIVSKAPLACYDNQAAFYVGPVDYCTKLGLVYGTNIDGVQIILAEVCYDVNDMSVDFIHFVAGERSPILQKQDDLSPNNITYTLQEGQLFSVAQKDFSKMKIALEGAVRNDFIGYERIAEYHFERLTPVSSYAGRLRHLTDSFDSVNLITWWHTLESITWRQLFKIVDKYAMESPIDIYMGTSGIVQYPAKDGCYDLKDLTYQVDTTEAETVPAQVWSYFKPRAANLSDAVVVGVNSPFLKFDDALFGTNICSDLTWLNPITQIRQMPALGYLFCPSQEQASKNLKGFPNIS